MYRKRIILFTVSVLLLASLFYFIDYNEFFRVASKISLYWISILVAIQAFITLFNALKWYVVIRRYAVSFRNVLYSSLIGMMVNNVTPMSIVGGEAVRAYVISRIDRIKLEKAFATIFVDLFLTIVPVLFLNLISIFLVLKYSFDLRIVWFLALIGAFLLALITASLSILLDQRPSLRLFNQMVEFFGRVRFLRKYAKGVESQVDDLFASFHRSIHNTMTDVWTLTVGLILSSATWFLSLIRIYLIFLALGIPINFEVVVIVYAMLITVSILPLLPGALGMWEWIGTGMFTFFGIPLESAAATVVLDRLLFYWMPLFLGFISSLHVGLNVMKLVDRPD